MSDICFFTDILILDNPLSPFPPFLCKLHSFYLTNWVPGFTSFFFQLVLPWPASSVVRSVIGSHEWNRRRSLGVQTLRAPSVFKKLSPQVKYAKEITQKRIEIKYKNNLIISIFWHTTTVKYAWFLNGATRARFLLDPRNLIW